VRALEDINVNTMALLEDLQHVAYELHPSVLEDLGLRAAIQCYVDDVAKWHNIRITFSANDDFKVLPREIASCLYRIAQEAVRNALKYAQSSDIAVTLVQEEAAIRLTVADSGQGFDVEKVKCEKHGLGLVSMEERARLMDGQVTIASQPGQGTVIRVFAPLTLTP
jgi:signal transduction histidine kinase